MYTISGAASRVLSGTAMAPIQVRSPEIMQGIGNIVQNAASFARREVHIDTRWTSEWSEVEVSDDGPGFDPAQEAQGVHLGLVGMRERVESLGGRLYVAAQVGTGVHITAHLPLQEPKEVAADA